MAIDMFSFYKIYFKCNESYPDAVEIWIRQRSLKRYRKFMNDPAFLDEDRKALEEMVPGFCVEEVKELMQMEWRKRDLVPALMYSW